MAPRLDYSNWWAKDTWKGNPVTWVLLLKANCAISCIAWLATVLWPLLGAIKKRLIKKRLIHRQGVTLSSEASYNCTVMLG